VGNSPLVQTNLTKVFIPLYLTGTHHPHVTWAHVTWGDTHAYRHVTLSHVSWITRS